MHLHKSKLSLDFRLHLHRQPITMWGNLIMQPQNNLHLTMHNVHFIIHLHKIGASKLKHPWQCACRPSSKGSNHNWIRHHPLHTNFMCFSGHQWFAPWWSYFSCLHKQNLPTLQDFDWPTAYTTLQRWCIDCSTLFRTPPITEGSSSLDWPRNWSYEKLILCKQAEHGNTPPGDIIWFARKTLVILNA